MRSVRLVQNLHLDGGIRKAGSLVEGDEEFCEQLIARGIAVLDAALIEPLALAALGDPVEAIDDALAGLGPVAEQPAPVVSPRRRR